MTQMPRRLAAALAVAQDTDGVLDGADACHGHDDAQDTDGDGIPNGCDYAADMNNDGVRDGGDIQIFVAFFLIAHPRADLNGDGFVDLGDIQAFLNAFLAG